MTARACTRAAAPQPRPAPPCPTPVQVEAEAGEVLDEEAAPFVLKLYRVVIYETERAAMAAGGAA